MEPTITLMPQLDSVQMKFSPTPTPEPKRQEILLYVQRKTFRKVWYGWSWLTFKSAEVERPENPLDLKQTHQVQFSKIYARIVGITTGASFAPRWIRKSSDRRAGNGK